MYRRLALVGSLAGLATGAVALAPPAAHAAVDTLPPQVTVTIAAPDGFHGWHRTAVDLSVRATDRSGVDEISSRVWLTGAESTELAFSSGLADHRVTTDGRTSVHWEITDTEGNTSAGSRDIALDAGRPTAAVDGGRRFVDQAETVPVRALCEEAVSGLASCYLEGAVTQRPDGTSVVDTREARDVTVTAVAVDNAGNSTRTDRTLSVVAPGTGPAVALTTTTPQGSDGWYRGQVRFVAVGTAGDPRVPVTGVEYNVDSGEIVRSEGATRAEFLVGGEGQHHVWAAVSDARGLRAHATTDVKIDSVQPQVAYDGPTTLEQGARVRPGLQCADADGGSGIASCRFTHGVDTDGYLDTTEPGTRLVEFEARDQAGNVRSGERFVQVVEARAPQTSTTALTVPTTVTSRQAVRATITLGEHGATGGEVLLYDGTRIIGRYTVPAAVRLAPSDWSSAVTVTLPRLAPGSHRLLARYRGSDLAAPSQSSTVTVTSRSPATVAARYAVRAGRHLATVTVHGLDARAAGTVTVLDGRREVGSATLRGGTAVVRLVRLARGSHRLTVRYAGSPTVQAAASRVTRLRMR